MDDPSEKTESGPVMADVSQTVVLADPRFSPDRIFHLMNKIPWLPIPNGYLLQNAKDLRWIAVDREKDRICLPPQPRRPMATDEAIVRLIEAQEDRIRALTARVQAAEEGKPPTPGPVDAVVDLLTRDRVNARDRTRIRDAVTGADKRADGHKAGEGEAFSNVRGRVAGGMQTLTGRL